MNISILDKASFKNHSQNINLPIESEAKLSKTEHSAIKPSQGEDIANETILRKSKASLEQLIAQDLNAREM